MKHPPLEQLARHLHAVAKLIDTHAGHDHQSAAVAKCRCLDCRADLLAATGWPTTTLGDGGSHSSDPTSSTERAATTPNPWATISHDLDQTLRHLWHTGLHTQTLIDRIVAHAPDDDPIPAGTGPCTIRTCDHVCRPRRNPNDRLRSGLCPACWTSWQKHQTRHPASTPIDWRPIRTAALRPRAAAK